MMKENSLLNDQVKEVIRVMSPEQQAEAEHFAGGLQLATAGLRQAIVTGFSNGRVRSVDPFSFDGKINSIVNTMAWSDLELAEANGFQAFSKSDKMYLGRLATAVTEKLAVATNNLFRTELGAVAINFSGLHMTMLGSRALAETDEGESVLNRAVRLYGTSFITKFMSQNRAAAYGTRGITSVSKGNMFDHIPRSAFRRR
jgi:hypothetical protein